ncbi:nucleotide exchange factor GrpE [Nocardioides sp. NBC_00368]
MDAADGDASDSDGSADAGSDTKASDEEAIEESTDDEDKDEDDETEDEADVIIEDESEVDLMGDAADEVDKRVAELTTDLQRLQAEYVNYKKRVDRDRELVSQNATYKVLTPIVEVLDTIDRAREHGEVEGGFKAVADQLEKIVTNLGLKKFGEPGDVFDPNRHEALSHMGTDPEVEETSVKLVAKAGYMIGDRVVRAAQVLVVDPE